MRSILGLALLHIGCTSAASPGAPSYDSVRDRLAAAPERLRISSTDSGGSLTASRYTPGGWEQGTAMLSIASGAIESAVGDGGRLELIELDVNIEPIEIPTNVFGKPTRLTDLRAVLAVQPVVTTTWVGDNDATATMMVELDASWTLGFDGGSLPLAPQHLPALPAELSITGDGDHVIATLSLDGRGELWSWAGLVKLTALQLVLAASTLD